MKKMFILSMIIGINISSTHVINTTQVDENKISLTTQQAKNIVGAFMRSIETGAATTHIQDYIAQNREPISAALSNFVATLDLSAEELAGLQQLGQMMSNLNTLVHAGDQQFKAWLEEGKARYAEEAARLQGEGIGITHDIKCSIYNKINTDMEEDPRYKEYVEAKKTLVEMNERFLFALGGSLGEYETSMDQETMRSIKQQRLMLLDALCKLALPVIEQEIEKKKLTQELQLNILDVQSSDSASSSSIQE